MNIPEYNGSTLYHYIKIEYLFNILQKRQFILRRVDTWEDKYECAADALRVCIEDKLEVDGVKFSQHFYGASFTETEEDEAMWKRYTLADKGVRLELDVSELKSSLSHLKINIQRKIRENNQFHEVDCCTMNGSLAAPALSYVLDIRKKDAQNICYTNIENASLESCTALIAKVHYVSNEEKEVRLKRLATNARNCLKESPDGYCREAFYELFYKRNPFLHENEVRIIVDWEWNNQLEDELNLPMHVDPTKLIKSITVDSRLSEEFAEIKNNLCSQYGVPSCAVKRSTLFDSPEVQVISY